MQRVAEFLNQFNSNAMDFFLFSVIETKSRTMAQGSKEKKPGKPKQKGGKEKKGIMKKGSRRIAPKKASLVKQRSLDKVIFKKLVNVLLNDSLNFVNFI
jgi:hypothetical protein